MYIQPLFTFLSTLLLGINSFHLPKRILHNKKPHLHVVNNNFENVEYIQDLNAIHHFKHFFKIENYNDIINGLNEHQLSRIFVDNNYKQLISVSADALNKNDLYEHYSVVDINSVILPNLVEKANDNHLPIYFVNFASDTILNIQKTIEEIFMVGSYGISVLFLISLLSYFANVNSFSSNRMNIKNKSQPNKPFGGFSPFNGDTEEKTFNTPNVTLNSWAGSEEVVEECKEVISYIENKEKYNKIGADMPKGILLEGPPGTGKTLLAKAIASETNSTFISISGSEFVELFVGMGASRVRELFNNARENAPCIIFIDEIDAVGRQRGAGVNMANDEREQTLNQLLYEMDGFNNNEDIVVMAATNRKDVLDQALLRPGRFDRIIRVPLPDKQSREKILEYYFNTKYINTTFDISSIAELTDGFSGAQLKNLINEAAIISVKNNYTKIQEKYIFDAFEKSIVGLIKSNATIAPSTKLRVAIHESGHSLLALKYNNYFDFQKASVQPTYNGAGGYTIFTEKPEIREGGLYTKDLLKKRLIIAMGGKAAEAVYYGTEFVSLGAIQDLKQANNLAKKMIGNFGMGDKLEVFFNENTGDDSNPFLGRSLSFGDKYSEYTRFIMDKESLELVSEAYSIAKNVLEENKHILIEFSELLQNNTVIYNREILNKYVL